MNAQDALDSTFASIVGLFSKELKMFPTIEQEEIPEKFGKEILGRSPVVIRIGLQALLRVEEIPEQENGDLRYLQLEKSKLEAAAGTPEEAFDIWRGLFDDLNRRLGEAGAFPMTLSAVGVNPGFVYRLPKNVRHHDVLSRLVVPGVAKQLGPKNTLLGESVAVRSQDGPQNSLGILFDGITKDGKMFIRMRLNRHFENFSPEVTSVVDEVMKAYSYAKERSDAFYDMLMEGVSGV